MKKFEFNNSNVCINPNIYKIYEDGYQYYVHITTAQFFKGWSLGISINCNTWGYSGGCSSIDSVIFETEKDAFLAGLKMIKERLERETPIAKMNLAIKNQQFFPAEKQLSLF